MEAIDSLLMRYEDLLWAMTYVMAWYVAFEFVRVSGLADWMVEQIVPAPKKIRTDKEVRKEYITSLLREEPSPEITNIPQGHASVPSAWVTGTETHQWFESIGVESKHVESPKKKTGRPKGSKNKRYKQRKSLR